MTSRVFAKSHKREREGGGGGCKGHSPDEGRTFGRLEAPGVVPLAPKRVRRKWKAISAAIRAGGLAASSGHCHPSSRHATAWERKGRGRCRWLSPTLTGRPHWLHVANAWRGSWAAGHSLLTGGRINPFTVPACTISGLKEARTRLQTVYFPVLQHLLCVLGKIISRACAKKKTKAYGCQVSHFYRSFSNDIITVKGLKRGHTPNKEAGDSVPYPLLLPARGVLPPSSHRHLPKDGMNAADHHETNYLGRGRGENVTVGLCNDSSAVLRPQTCQRTLPFGFDLYWGQRESNP